MVKNFPHKERPQIVSVLVYQKFTQKLAAMLNTSLCPEAESRIFKLIIESIAGLDVDIKVRLRKGTHLAKIQNSSNLSDKKVMMNNILSKIESKEQYSLKMKLRNQDEKEIKVELMLCLFLRNIDQKIK